MIAHAEQNFASVASCAKRRKVEILKVTVILVKNFEPEDNRNINNKNDNPNKLIIVEKSK